MGTLEESIAMAEQALNAGPAGEAHAKVLLAQVVAKKPTHPRANMLLAMIATAHDDYAAAVFHLNRAILGNAKDGEARFMLGNCLLASNKVKEAAAAFKACLALAPGYAPAWDGLGKSYLRLDKPAEAEQAFESGVRATNGQDPWPYNQWANTLMIMGEMDKAAQVALRGVQTAGGGADQRGINLLEIAAFARNFVDQSGDPIEALKVDRALHDRIGDVYAQVRQASAHTGKPHTLQPAIEAGKSPLRVGFLSGDFGNHVCAAFMKPALLNFDSARVKPYCYSTQPDDGGEGPFKQACAWRDVTMLNDDQLASRILEDQIDVLIECSGLTPGRKQRAMTPRIAPVQCTWLGYPNTTGLPTMDYRMVDAITDPVGSEWQCRERLARIDGCFLCYTSNPWAGEVAPTEAMQGDLSAPITFGSFNRITKISDRTVRVWCEVLKRVPRSRLLIKLQTLTAGHMQRVLSRFTACGVEASRIEIAPWEYDAAAHARMYAKLDIALDTFPYNGTTTTCEALWMGVPVIALEGDSHRSRVGVSLLTAIGAQEWIAKDEAQFVEIAAKLAAARDTLREIRMSLRQRMMVSPLRDEKGYARRVESCLEWMWADAGRS